MPLEVMTMVKTIFGEEDLALPIPLVFGKVEDMVLLVTTCFDLESTMSQGL